MHGLSKELSAPLVEALREDRLALERLFGHPAVLGAGLGAGSLRALSLGM